MSLGTPIPIPPPQANVMLEYSIDEAESLLKKNQEAASTNLKQVEADMDFLREQITTMEVSILPSFTAASPGASVQGCS